MHTITEEQLRMFSRQLETEEKSTLTREKYLRDIRHFACWMADRPLTREDLLAYKQALSRTYALTSANSMIAAVNAFLRFLRREDLVLRQFRLQKTVWCPEAAALEMPVRLRPGHLQSHRCADQSGCQYVQTLRPAVRCQKSPGRCRFRRRYPAFPDPEHLRKF